MVHCKMFDKVEVVVEEGHAAVRALLDLHRLERLSVLELHVLVEVDHQEVD